MTTDGGWQCRVVVILPLEEGSQVNGDRRALDRQLDWDAVIGQSCSNGRRADFVFPTATAGIPNEKEPRGLTNAQLNQEVYCAVIDIDETTTRAVVQDDVSWLSTYREVSRVDDGKDDVSCRSYRRDNERSTTTLQKAVW